MTDLEQVADWLARMGLASDFFNLVEDPAPRALRLPLAQAWLRRDGTDEHTIEEYLEFVDTDMHWTAE